MSRVSISEKYALVFTDHAIFDQIPGGVPRVAENRAGRGVQYITLNMRKIVLRRLENVPQFGTRAVTVFISCLGLLGLAIFSTERRAREIGIRKVLGATEKPHGD